MSLGNIKISHKILFVVIAAIVLCAGFGITTLTLGKKQIKTLEEIYKEKVVPLDNLRKIQLVFRELEYRMAAVVADMIAPIGSGEHLKQAAPELTGLWDAAKGALTEEEVLKDKETFEEGFRGFMAMAPKLQKAYFNEDTDIVQELADEWLDFKPLIFKTIDNMAAVQEASVGQYYEQSRKLISKVNIIIIISSAVAILFLIILASIIIRSIKGPIDMVVKMASLAASGDLTCRINLASRDEMGSMTGELNKMLANFSGACSNFSTGSNDISAHAEKLLASSNALFKGTEEQSDQVKQLTAGLTEMVQTSEEMARNSTHAAETTRQSYDSAKAGKDVVNRTVKGILELSENIKNTSEHIEGLSKSSEEIGNVIAVIHDISDQTNLLALNAAIEAARAGELGRGFAVVADEVRILADKTTKATKDIAAKIGSIQKETKDSIMVMEKGKAMVEEAVSTAEQAEAVLNTIVENSDKVMDLVQSIATATEEQSATSLELNSSSEHTARFINDTVKLSSEVRHSADELSNIASRLNDQITAFKTAKGAGAVSATES